MFVGTYRGPSQQQLIMRLSPLEHAKLMKRQNVLLDNPQALHWNKWQWAAATKFKPGARDPNEELDLIELNRMRQEQWALMNKGGGLIPGLMGISGRLRNAIRPAFAKKAAQHFTPGSRAGLGPLKPWAMPSRMAPAVTQPRSVHAYRGLLRFGR